jgi:hypothetical protein
MPAIDFSDPFATSPTFTGSAYGDPLANEVDHHEAVVALPGFGSVQVVASTPAALREAVARIRLQNR